MERKTSPVQVAEGQGDCRHQYIYAQTQCHTRTHACTESDIHTHAWHHARPVNFNVHDQDQCQELIAIAHA